MAGGVDEGVLTVLGEDMPSTAREFFGENLVIWTAELGTMLRGVLLERTRIGTQIGLFVLVPSGTWALEEGPVTVAVITVSCRTQAMSGPGLRQGIGVHQLSGTMQG